MKKLTILLMLVLLLGCRTKKVLKSRTESKEVQKTEIRKDSISLKDSVIQKETVNKSEKIDKSNEHETDITIKGKVDRNNPLELHDIKNGDTLQTIRISGNADVTISSRKKSIDSKKSESDSKTISDKIKDFSQTIVDDNNISEKLSEIKNKAKEVKNTDVTTGVYITSIVLGATVILCLFIFLYLKKKKQ